MADDLDDLEAKARAAIERFWPAPSYLVTDPAVVLDLITRLRAEQERADRMVAVIRGLHERFRWAEAPASWDADQEERALLAEHDAARGNRG